MKNDVDIIEYSDRLLDELTQDLTIYDIWDIRPLQNDRKTIAAGKSNDIKGFVDFFTGHLNREYVFSIVIVFGNSQISDPNIMSNVNRTYINIEFNKHLELRNKEIASETKVRARQLVDEFSKLDESGRVYFRQMLRSFERNNQGH